MENMSTNLQAGQVIRSKQPIIENAVYDRNEAIAITGFSLSTLIRAEEAGKLKGRYSGRQRFYFGSDLLKWLREEKL
jgi:hypothetical protein